MNKTVLMLVLVSFLSLGLVVSGSHAAGTMGKRGLRTFNSMDLVGTTVMDSHDEFVGVVNGVMVDSGGHASAIVNYYDLYHSGGVNTLVPLQELLISRTKSGQDIAFLKTEMEYGIQPYWIQNGTAAKSRLTGLNSLDLIGASVRDSHGELMGIVQEVLVDSGGHAFAIINHGDYDLTGSGGINTPVPFQELQISQTKGGQDAVVLKTDMEHLDFAPYLDPAKRFDRQDEANIYEYYGIQPYWTENGASAK